MHSFHRMFAVLSGRQKQNETVILWSVHLKYFYRLITKMFIHSIWSEQNDIEVRETVKISDYKRLISVEPFLYNLKHSDNTFLIVFFLKEKSLAEWFSIPVHSSALTCSFSVRVAWDCFIKHRQEEIYILPRDAHGGLYAEGLKWWEKGKKKVRVELMERNNLFFFSYPEGRAGA